MASRITELILDCHDPRLLAAGAVPADVGQTGDESWHVLADPEGNEFCLLRKRVRPAEHQQH